MYVYVPSHQAALVAIHAKTTSASTLAITTSNSVSQLCETAGVSRLLSQEVPISLGRPGCISRLAEEADRVLSLMTTNQPFVLAHTAYSLLGFVIAKSWNQRGRPVHFVNMDPPRHHYRSLSHLTAYSRAKSALLLMMLRKRLGIPELFLTADPLPRITIDTRFLSAVQAEQYQASPPEIRKLAALALDPPAASDVLALLPLEIHSPEFETIRSFATHLRQIGLSVDLKPHPRTTTEDPFIKTLNCLPAHLPAEACCIRARIVVGIASTAMQFATTLKRKTVISLVNLVDWRSPAEHHRANVWVSRFSDSGLICRPKTLKEAVELVTRAAL